MKKIILLSIIGILLLSGCSSTKTLKINVDFPPEVLRAETRVMECETFCKTEHVCGDIILLSRWNYDNCWCEFDKTSKKMTKECFDYLKENPNETGFTNTIKLYSL